MKSVFKAAGAALVAASLLMAGSSCDQVKKQVAKKVTETAAKEATKKMASFETCDAALAMNLSEDQKTAFQTKLTEIITDAAQAKDKAAVMETKRGDVRALFQDSVKQSSADEKCVDLLTNHSMDELKSKLQATQ